MTKHPFHACGVRFDHAGDVVAVDRRNAAQVKAE